MYEKVAALIFEEWNKKSKNSEFIIFDFESNKYKKFNKLDFKTLQDELNRFKLKIYNKDNATQNEEPYFRSINSKNHYLITKI